jgi:hypothetical protein
MSTYAHFILNQFFDGYDADRTKTIHSQSPLRKELSFD